MADPADAHGVAVTDPGEVVPRRCRAPWRWHALAATILALAAHAEEGASAGSAAFTTVYRKPATESFQIYYDELRRERFLESVAAELNRVLVLPEPVTLATADCGHSTTRWNATNRTITVCYEFLDALVTIAGGAAADQPRAEQLFSGALTFALFAEVGHALVDELAIQPKQGALRAGDEFAAISLAAAERDGDPSAAAAVEFFDAALGRPAALEYLAAHRFDRGRLEAVACILYGNAPTNHAASLARGIVSRARAPRCQEEVVAAATRWDGYLKSHARGAMPWSAARTPPAHP